jgi:hypothetical protein
VARESAAARTLATGDTRWYEPLLDLLPVPLLLVLPETGRVVFANRAADHAAGGSFPLALRTADHPGVYGLRDRGGRPLTAAEHPAALAAAGAPAENLELDWPTPAGVRAIVASAGTLQLPDGERLIAVTFEDVTALEHARRRAYALAEIGTLLAGSLDFDATLERIAHLAVPRLADWCFVELVRADGSIERAAIAAEDPDLLAMAREYDRRYPLDPESPVGSPRVIRTGEADLMPEIPDAMLGAVAQDAQSLIHN